MTIQKDEKAIYKGVLIPELNYKNYKTFEAVAPEMEKMAGIEKVECHNDSLLGNMLWLVAGFAIGAFVVSVK